MEVLLLGAGASIDAGLPGTLALTAKVLDAVAQDSHAGSETKVLTYVAGALLYAEGIAGRSPIDAAVDIEALYRALLRLERRDETDVAPFVASWHPAIAQLEAIRQKSDHPHLKGLGAFQLARLRVLKELRHILWRDDLAIDYLAPLLELVQRQRELTVITLNFDNVIETFCRFHDVECWTGLPPGQGHHPDSPPEVTWLNEGVNLVKLHGSLNWGKYRQPNAYEYVMTFGTRPPNFVGTQGGPGVMFGDGKLSAVLPFPDLFGKFRDCLKGATRLTVIGYSFRDEHVNAEIYKFVSRNSTPKSLRVVDPSPPIAGSFLQGFSPLRRERIQYIESTAAEALPTLFGE